MAHCFPDKQLSVYVFGDQTYDVADTLLSLTQTHDDTLLLDFLSRSCDVLQQEVSRLPAHQRVKCPPFASLADLLPPYRHGTLNTAFVQALTCIAQLGLFLGRVSKGCQEYPSERNSVSVGICTGALAAAAVSSAHSATSLVLPALEAISVAVRLGALAWDAADRISYGQLDNKDEDVFPSWSWVTTGSTVDVMEQALGQYALQTGLPLTALPYIAATGGTTQSVISGPPNIVPEFLASTLGKSVVKTSMPIRITAPYHSGVLYSQEDLSRILLSDLAGEESIPLRVPVLSACSDGQYPDGRRTFTDALEMAVQDCMMRRLALDTLPGRIAQHVKAIRGRLAHQNDDGQYMAVEIQPISFQGADRLGLHVAQSVKSDASSPVKCSVTVHERWPLFVDSTKSDPHRGSHSTATSRLAILSASGRFPGHADTMDEFWDILLSGIDTHEMVPPERWSASAHVGDTLAKNVSGTGFGCWLHQAAQFDAAYFNMSPREAAQVDPAQRLALMAATEALEQAGIVPNRTKSTHKKRVGVWFGCTSNDWMETNSAQNIDTYFIPGGNRAFIPGRINYHFKFSGPSFTIDTACSSSLAALHMACNALWRGEVDTAIVGGTNVLTNPDMTAGLDRGHFLSRTGNCKTFDDGADGYCRGEAVVTLILKRLDDAVLDKDPIQACIPPRGVATNHNAEAESITRPHAAAQKELFEHILNATGVRASDISYVEMHGTGTQAGDFGETTSVVTTLSPTDSLGYCLRPDDQPLHIGAVKSNVGHGEAAAGVTSLAKVLLMFKHNTIPPHIGVKTKLNHRLPDLRAHNTRIATVPTPWEKPDCGIRRVLLNNFSAAGGNTAIILEDPSRHDISRLVSDPDPRRFHIVTISGKTSEALISNLRNTVAWIDRTASTSSDINILAKLSYTTTSRRMHHRYRVAVTATDLHHVKTLLQKQVDRRSNGDKCSPMPAKTPRFVFCFTGQGSPYAGMGADLFVRFASFRADVQRYNHTCVQLGLPSILSVFEMDMETGSLDGISPVVLQLSHVCFQMALYRLWKSFGVAPTAVVGHSLGEYAALYASGALTQTSVIHLVGRRAQLMDKYLDAGTYTMLVVMVGEHKVESTLANHNVTYEISCRNGKNNTVIGGTRAQINAAKVVLEASGITCHSLGSPFAFHTSQADPILDHLLRVSEACPIQKPTIPVISPTRGKVLYSGDDFGKAYFVQHCRHPVNMLQALTNASSEGLIDEKTVGIEIGPAPVVTRMVKEVVGPSMQTFASVHKAMDTWQVLCEALAGIYTLGSPVNWDQYHNDFAMCHEVLQLPAYGWTLKEYWLQYVHHWSLRKGDEPPVLTANLAFSEIYKVRKNTISGSKSGEVIVDLDLNHGGVHEMAQGHKVYGVPLCTPSVYADISMMIGNYTKQMLGLDEGETATEIADMHIMAALVANDAGNEQTLRTSAKLDADTQSLLCSFLTVDSNGKETQLHATCSIRFAEIRTIKSRFEEAAFTARQRIQFLANKSREPGSNTYRFNTGMIYKMVGQLAEFAPQYRGLSAITLDNDALEAAGTISFSSTASDGDSLWFMNPAYLDAFSQLGGFVMNANEEVDLDKELYVNHGWASMRLFRSQLDPKATYHSYVKMKEGKDNLWSGDVLIFDEGYELIGVIGGVALQGVQKRLMEYIIRSANKKVRTGVPTSRPSEPTPATVEMKKSSAKPVDRDEIQPDPAVVVITPQETSMVAAIDPWQTVLDIISEESGVDKTELGDDVSLADIGIDSLLSLVVCGRLRDDLDVDLPDGALFQECFCIGDIKKRVPGAAGSAPAGNLTPPSSEQNSSNGHDIGEEDINSVSSGSETTDSDFVASPSDSIDDETPLTPSVFFNDDKFTPQVTTVEVSPDEEPVKPAWSLYLQGSRKHSSSTLFLFPDGCGAATSYMDLPPVSHSLAVVGFNSPFMKTPHLMYEHTLPQVLHSYLAGIRSRQPHGPYHLGGWSAGGILAYALAAQLLAAGEAVASLTLIDSPPPDRGLDHLPERFFAHCTRVGVFGTEMARGQNEAVAKGGGNDQKALAPPEWLLPHFRATIDLLHDYHAPPLSARNSSVMDMKVSIIWAQACALDGVRYPKLPPREAGQAEDEEGVKFLSEPRNDFGPGRWAGLFPPGVSISTHTVEGEHHFSMMRGAGAERLAQLIKDATGCVS